MRLRGKKSGNELGIPFEIIAYRGEEDKTLPCYSVKKPSGRDVSPAGRI